MVKYEKYFIKFKGPTDTQWKDNNAELVKNIVFILCTAILSILKLDFS